ncbi:hypothetical protein DFS34DRAFT_449590 [Phlyctochytrium arcticum]|nr:hypothetical protein DFS34DRAFT_449590 [Phlyctochytrium arcticum]
MRDGSIPFFSHFKLPNLFLIASLPAIKNWAISLKLPETHISDRLGQRAQKGQQEGYPDDFIGLSSILFDARIKRNSSLDSSTKSTMFFHQVKQIAYLATLLLLVALQFANASPSPNPQDMIGADPNGQSQGPQLNMDCMVTWSEYSCCADNMKTRDGRILMQPQGKGKQCPITLARKEYCLVGDEECKGSSASSLGKQLGGAVLLFSLLSTTVVIFF